RPPGRDAGGGLLLHTARARQLGGRRRAVRLAAHPPQRELRGFVALNPACLTRVGRGGRLSPTACVAEGGSQGLLRCGLATASWKEAAACCSGGRRCFRSRSAMVPRRKGTTQILV